MKTQHTLCAFTPSAHAVSCVPVVVSALPTQLGAYYAWCEQSICRCFFPGDKGEAAELCRLILSKTSQTDVWFSRACWSRCPSALIEELIGRSSAYHCLNPGADSRINHITLHWGGCRQGCAWSDVCSGGSCGCSVQAGIASHCRYQHISGLFLSQVLKPGMKAKQKFLRDQGK